MSDCPMWRPDCQARAAFNVVDGTARAVRAIAKGTGQSLDLLGEASGKIGFLLPFLLIGFLLWVAFRLIRFGRDATLGFGDAFTNGAVSDVLGPRTRQSTSSIGVKARGKRAASKPARRTGAGQRLGLLAGNEVRARRGAGRPNPFRPDPHTGQGVSIFDRTDDRAGQVRSVVVCAPDASSALVSIESRMSGIRWSKTSSAKCDLNPGHKHHRFGRR